MDREDAAAGIVGVWRRERERGAAPSPEQVILRHPDLAAELREAFAACQLLETALAEGASSASGVAAGGVAAPSPPPVARLGDFRLLREIGRGGMGVVYEAEQVPMARRVAIKVLYPSVTQTTKAVERFRREAQATGRLHHTNIVEVHALGSAGGQWYYAMEFVRGRSLDAVLADLRRWKVGPHGRSRSTGRSSVLSTGTGRREEYARVARMFAGLAEALATAHGAGVVHRDIKPSNLMLDEAGTLKILDFGLAAVHEATNGVTVTGDIVGTPAYMSPEQALARKVDGRTDVYSLGATLYEVLTLNPPVAGRDVAETLRNVVGGEPRRPRRLEPRIPRDLETILLMALEKEPGRRYATAEALARDLRAFADGFAVAARRAGPAERAWRYLRRRPARTALASGALLALAAAVMLGVGCARARAERDREAARRLDLEYRTLLMRAMMGDKGGVAADAGESRGNLLARAIALAPDRPEAWYERVFSRGGDLQPCLDDLEAARARGLPSSQYHLARAVRLRWSGRRADSLAEEALAADAPSGDREVQYLRGYLASLDGQFAEAEAAYGRAIDGARPDQEVVQRTLAARSDERVRLGDWDGALADLLALRAHVRADVPLPSQDARIAWLWTRVGRAEAAQRCVDLVLAEYEKDASPGEYVLLLQELADRGCNSFFRQVLAAGLRRHPDDVGLLHARVRYLPPAERLAGVEEILRRHPDHQKALIWRAEALLAVSRAAEAAGIVERLVEDYGPTEDLVGTQAIAYRQLGRFDEAEGLYRAALAQRPSSRLAAGYAQFLRARGRPQEALVVAERALETDRVDVQLNDEYVGALQQAGRADDALKAARRTLALSSDWFGFAPHFLHPPCSMGALVALAPAEAVPLLERTVRDHPEHPHPRAELALALLMLGRAADAREVLERPPPLEGYPYLAWVRAEAQLLAERWPETLAAAQALEHVAPDQPSACLVTGIALLNLGRSAEAIPVLHRYLALRGRTSPASPTPAGDAPGFTWRDPAGPAEDAWAHYTLSIAWTLAGGDPACALSEARAAVASADEALASVALDREHRALALQWRGFALAALGRWEEAKETTQRLIALESDLAGAPRGHAYAAHSDVLMWAGEFEEAAAAMKEAIRWAGSEGAPAAWFVGLARALFYGDHLPEVPAATEEAMRRGARTVGYLASWALSLGTDRSETAVARARAFAARAQAEMPDSMKALDAVGAAHAMAGEWAEASAALAKVAGDPAAVDDFIAPALLARAYLHQGRAGEAAEMLRSIRGRPGWPSHSAPVERRLVGEVTREVEAASAATPR